MTLPRLFSISRRLMSCLVAAVMLVAVVTMTGIYFQAVDQQEAIVARQADDYLDYLVGALEQPLWNFDDVTIETICRAVLQNDLVVAIQIKESSGRIRFSHDNSNESGILRRVGTVTRAGEALGTVEIALSRRTAEESGRQLQYAFAVLILVVAIIFVLLTFLFVYLFLHKPLVLLQEIVHQYAEGRYDAPLPDIPYLEFRAFGETLAQMGKTIQSQIDELKSHRERLEDQVGQRTAELLAAKEQAEGASRAKSVFLSNMSHELRTPLNAVLGFAQLMRNGRNVSQEQLESLGIISRSGTHLLHLLNNVLDISKIEAGRLELESSPIDLHQLLQEMESLLSVRAKEKGLTFTVEQAQDLPRHIAFDAGKLRQVLLNLIGNAVKFTPSGWVILRAMVDDKDGDQPWLRFEVQDSGPGISAEEREQIFQPFAQLKNRPASESGTGLGLTICRQFVELMGGEIGVSGASGQGSIFWFTVPVSVLSDDSSVAANGHGRVVGLAEGEPLRRLLIAEDQPENSLLLRKLLAPFGFELNEAVNGWEAVAVCQEWQPDLIFMDIRMPVMDGLEASRRIKADKSGSTVKIVAVTAHAFEEERHEILAAGCDGFIRKPYDHSEIFEALSKYLGVRFVYEKEKETAVPRTQMERAALGSLPDELLGELEEALCRIDGEAVNRVITAIRAHDAALAEALATEADDLQYGLLLRLLRSVCPKIEKEE